MFWFAEDTALIASSKEDLEHTLNEIKGILTENDSAKMNREKMKVLVLATS